MFRRNKKTRKYQTPMAKVTPVVFESNFCATVRFQLEADPLKNMNDPNTEGYDANEAFYFDS